MEQIVNLTLKPAEACSESVYKKIAASKLGINAQRIHYIRIIRKSTDARQRDIKINLSLQVFIDETPKDLNKKFIHYTAVDGKTTVIVVGSGPAGLFAALKLIENGIKPIVLERGKDVSERKKDVALISREHKVNPESNYCFGEGGAGTFSDGKLYTRSNKRGNLQRIYEIFHQHGATDEILYEAHPHIGTDNLPEVIKAMRQTIISCGGEIHFNTRVDDLLIKENVIIGVITNQNVKIESRAVIIATGHSSREIYEMLNHKGIELIPKPFAVGVRAEHPQELIDKIQYHGNKRGEFLPAASYSLVEQVNGRGVFSFCMCPGGFIVPSATTNNQVVVNGMSASKRNSAFANSGIVVEVKPEDLTSFQKYGPLAGIEFQNYIENLAWQNGDQKQTAPAQRLDDFVNGKASTNLPKISYFPGTVLSPLHQWLPEFIATTLREGFKHFDRKMKGYLTNEAVVLGVESRTSSPVRIPRDVTSFMHPQVNGLFPCGEGAGYAGGIASSAMDGENCADKVAEYLKTLRQ